MSLSAASLSWEQKGRSFWAITQVGFCTSTRKAKGGAAGLRHSPAGTSAGLTAHTIPAAPGRQQATARHGSPSPGAAPGRTVRRLWCCSWSTARVGGVVEGEGTPGTIRRDCICSEGVGAARMPWPGWRLDGRCHESPNQVETGVPCLPGAY